MTTPQTLTQLFFHAIDRFATKRAALRYKAEGEWLDITPNEMARKVKQIGLGLRALGVHPGDRVANSPAASDQESHGGVLVKKFPGAFSFEFQERPVVEWFALILRPIRSRANELSYGQPPVLSRHLREVPQ